MKAEIYDPKLFGFRVNEMAKLKRWREAQRDR
jgi:casein kinase II subunit beta